MGKYKLIIPLWIFGIISFIFILPKFIRILGGDNSYLLTWWFLTLCLFGALGTFGAYILINQWLNEKPSDNIRKEK